MSKLLSAGYQRLIKCKALWICSAFMAVTAIYLPISCGEVWYPLEDWCFTFAAFVPILSAIVAGLFVGTEYSDGAIRNKLVVGHKRSSIYFTNLILTFTASILMCATFLVPYLAVGIPILGFFEAPVVMIILHILCSFAMAATFDALYVLVAMLCQSKAVTAVVCIIMSVVILFAGLYIHSMLDEPEYYDSFEMTANGQVMDTQPEANPHFLRGTKRQVYEFLFDFLPGGQAVQLTANSVAHLPMLPLYDLIIIIAASAVGLILFKRKDIK